MRVLLVTGIYPPDIGGPATYMPQLANSLSNNGHDVIVVTLSDVSTWPGDASAPYQVVRIPRPMSKGWRLPVTVRTLRRWFTWADVVLANGLFMEVGLARQGMRVPVVMKVVGDWAWERAVGRKWLSDSVDVFQEGRYTWRVRLLKLVRTWMFRQADWVYTPSEYLRRLLSRWGLAPERVRVISNAVVVPGGPPEPAALPTFDGWTLVTVGRLAFWKGMDGIIRALTDLPDVRLVVVGDGPEGASLRLLATSLGVANRVFFAGRVPAENVGAYTRAADLFVLNSTLVEGMPIAVLEAMALGVPVIATAVGGTPEVVVHDVNGVLVPPRDDRALVAAIRAMLDDPARRARLVQGGRATVEQRRFTWSTHVGEVERLLAEATMAIAPGTGRRPPTPAAIEDAQG